MKPGILYIEDKLGVTSGYEPIWQLLLTRAGLMTNPVWRINMHKKYPGVRWLLPFANRKAPTWNPKEVATYKERLGRFIADHNISIVLCSDQAAIGLLGLPPEIATLDNLRGGVYWLDIGREIPWVISIPISAWHKQVKEKDLAAVNRGFVDKGEFEEFYTGSSSEDSGDNDSSGIDTDSDSVDTDDDVSDSESDVSEGDADSEALFYEPVVVPYGRFVLLADMRKVARLVNGKKTDSTSSPPSDPTAREEGQ